MEPKESVKVPSNLVTRIKSGRKMSSTRPLAMTMGDSLKEKQVITIIFFSIIHAIINSRLAELVSCYRKYINPVNNQLVNAIQINT